MLVDMYVINFAVTLHMLCYCMGSCYVYAKLLYGQLLYVFFFIHLYFLAY